MRTTVGLKIAALVALAAIALGAARLAMAGEARQALDAASAALAAQPPQREAARSAFERAITAADDPGAVSEAYFRLGALEEDDEAFAQAMAHYRQSVAAASAGSGVRWTRNASSRIQWLSMHSEGNFAPLARLHRFQRDRSAAADPDALGALARDADAFPAGIVRAESRVLVATAWLRTLHRPGEAIRLFRLVATDPAADGLSLRFAERGLVDALIADGRTEEAAREAQTHATQLEPEVVSRLRRLGRRAAVLRIAEIDVALFIGFAAAWRYVSWRRRHRREAPRSPRRVVRAACAVWCVASILAAAYIVVGTLVPDWLGRIGL